MEDIGWGTGGGAALVVSGAFQSPPEAFGV